MSFSVAATRRFAALDSHFVSVRVAVLDSVIQVAVIVTAFVAVTALLVTVN